MYDQMAQIIVDDALREAESNRRTGLAIRLRMVKNRRRLTMLGTRLGLVKDRSSGWKNSLEMTGTGNH